MNRYKFFITIGLLVIALCAVMVLSGCFYKFNIIGMSDYYYEDPEKYSVGEATLTESIENIDISWIAGDVTVVSHEGATLVVEETFNENEDMRLRYLVEDGTLKIKFCASGKQNFNTTEKDLTVKIPKTTLRAFKFSGISADLNLNCTVVDSVEASTTSGNIVLIGCNVISLVKVNTISGKTEVNLMAPMNEFNGKSTSGTFSVNAPSVTQVDVGTVSGDISLTVTTEPDQLIVDTTSGNVNLTLPRNSAFTLEYHSTSGEVRSDLPYTKSSKKYIFGVGNKGYMVSTVSGNLWIKSPPSGEGE